jgi:hypothetical protein
VVLPLLLRDLGFDLLWEEGREGGREGGREEDTGVSADVYI